MPRTLGGASTKEIITRIQVGQYRDYPENFIKFSLRVWSGFHGQTEKQKDRELFTDPHTYIYT